MHGIQSNGSMEASNRLVRILCLHGHEQNAQLFRQKTGSLRKALRNTAEFIYIDAPHQSSTPTLRTWWLRPSGTQVPQVYEGWDESRESIQQSIHEHWPIDVLLGFSQGAAAAALYMVQQQQQHEEALSATRAVRSLISIAGFIPRDERYREVFYNNTKKHLELHSCHIYGDMDDIITPEQSRELSQALAAMDPSDVVVCSHRGGHMVPTLRKGDTSTYDGDDEDMRRVVALSQNVKDFVRRRLH